METKPLGFVRDEPGGVVCKPPGPKSTGVPESRLAACCPCQLDDKEKSRLGKAREVLNAFALWLRGIVTCGPAVGAWAQTAELLEHIAEMTLIAKTKVQSDIRDRF